LGPSFLLRAVVYVTPGATALILTPWNALSRAEHFTIMLTMLMDVEKTAAPGRGVSPAEAERMVAEPLLSFRKGEARETRWRVGLTFRYIISSQSLRDTSSIEWFFR
jgi:hypothetical protein